MGPKSQTKVATVGVSGHWQKDVVDQKGPSHLWLLKPDKASRKSRQKTAVPAQRLSKGKGGPVGQDYDGYTREKGWIWVLAQWQSTCLAYPTSWFRLLTLKERVAKARRYFWVKSLRVFKGMGL